MNSTYIELDRPILNNIDSVNNNNFNNSYILESSQDENTGLMIQNSDIKFNRDGIYFYKFNNEIYKVKISNNCLKELNIYKNKKIQRYVKFVENGYYVKDNYTYWKIKIDKIYDDGCLMRIIKY